MPRAVEKWFIEGVPVEDTIKACTDPFDFMIKAKMKGRDVLMLDDERQQKTSRYYVAKQGGELYKIAPPVKGAAVGQWKRKNGITDQYYHQVLREVGDQWDERIHTKNKSTYQNRRTELQKGYQCAMCNKASNFDFNNLNYQYYIDQANKLIF